MYMSSFYNVAMKTDFIYKVKLNGKIIENIEKTLHFMYVLKLTNKTKNKTRLWYANLVKEHCHQYFYDETLYLHTI